ncbi:MAG: DUF2089 domain-containing protein [Anaerolineae bacterium]|nr:DUF2089 domain-containing protein [Anaerolineae bacterium]
MRRLLTTCPACNGDLIVTELSCTSCDTVIKGRYTGCSFCELPDENLRFLELFVACRGNIKEMERETGLGYWTIRGRLDEVVKELQIVLANDTLPADDGNPTFSGTPAEQRRAILETVARGELSLIEAERKLAHLAQQRKRSP